MRYDRVLNRHYVKEKTAKRDFLKEKKMIHTLPFVLKISFVLANWKAVTKKRSSI